MDKQDTIAATMRQFMATSPSVTEFASYKALNDYVGKLHGKPAGKCQELSGEKAWAWTADQTTGVWRPATPAEVEAKRQNAAEKNHGTRGAKVLSDADRAVLDAQVAALAPVVAKDPALAPLLAELTAKRNADDAARKGSLKDRLAAAVDKLGLARAVDLLEEQVAELTIEETITEVEKAIEAKAENA